MTINEVATYFGKKPCTIRRWRKQGVLTGYVCPPATNQPENKQQYLFLRSDVEHLLVPAKIMRG